MMKIGDMVKWTSTANGNDKTKIGKVVCVIPANIPVTWVKAVKQLKETHVWNSFGSSRDHESYLVSVNPIGKGKPRLYWPRVSGLNLINHTQEVG